jgi:DNA-binding transcriptional LysR family regulator
MNSRQLEAFRAVARTGTVTAAAQVLFISQPAVSRLLAHLEAQLSLALFSRAKGRLRLTPEGSALLVEVERHFAGLESIELAAARIARHGPGSLRVVGFPSASSGELPHAISRVLAAHPETAITLDTDTTDRIVSAVESCAYDVGFTAGQVSEGRAVEARVIASRPWVCVFPKSHRLAGQKKIGLDDLAGMSLVGFSPGMSLRVHIDRLLLKCRVVPNFAASAQTIESICALVAAGCGGAIIHPYATHVTRMHGLSTSVIEPTEVLDLTAVLPRAPRRSAFADEFVRSVEHIYAAGPEP